MRSKRWITGFLLVFMMGFYSCYGQSQKAIERLLKNPLSLNFGTIVSGLGKNIGCIYQDKNNHFWFASNGDGVYRYDGKNLVNYSEKDGLCSNFVLKIEEDINGKLWFSTWDGICTYNGTTFTDYTSQMNAAPTGRLSYRKGGLFFGLLKGMCFYDGSNFTAFSIHPDTYKPATNNMNRPYSVYSSLIDKKGNVWFGTQEKGVCRYDGNSFTFFTGQGLDKAAVRTLFQDKTGTIWAGNNGAGLFRFNGHDFINITEQRGLGNPDFLKKLKGKEGTLARPWTINEDDKGNLWIGTIDAGVWKFDGKNLRNYSTRDGLAGNAIWTIFKDKKGELWFVTDGNAICKFNGKKFIRHEFK